MDDFIDATPEEMDEIRRMSDEELMDQINGYDPYDLEFARRFRAQAEQLKAADALAVECKRLEIIVENALNRGDGSRFGIATSNAFEFRLYDYLKARKGD